MRNGNSWQRPLLSGCALLILACGLLPPDLSAGALQLHPLLGDHAVVQADVPLPVWGRGPTGATVTVSCGRAVQTTAIATDGSWRVELPPLTAGTCCEIVVRDDRNETVTATNVLAGEVWLASGQSNMLLPLGETDGAEAEAASADLPQVRWFGVPQKTSVVPLDWTLGGSWQCVRPATAKGCSAVAYYFAKQLHTARHVPVGLVVAAWGGTPISAWLNDASLATIPEFAGPRTERSAQIQAFNSGWQRWAGRNQVWFAALAGRDPGVAAHWEAPAQADADWPTVRLPAKWAERDATLKGLVGSVWLRRRVMIPQDWHGLDLCLFLACINDYAEVWVDGHRVYQDGPDQRGMRGSWRRVRVPADAFAADRENLIAVRVVTTRGDGGLYSSWPFQIAPWDASPQVTSAVTRLQETDWHWRVGCRVDGDASQPPPPLDEPSLPDGPGSLAVLADGMISAVSGFPIRGAVWYQGENDAGRENAPPPIYLRQLTALVNEWRARWHNPGLPVLVVQLPQIGKPSPPDKGGSWPRLREAQQQILSLPHTGLAVTIDTAPDGNLHPRNKRPVGERLSLLARRIAYGENIPSSGPVYAGLEVAGAQLRLNFAPGGSALRGDARGEVTGCCIAGADHNFVPARARIEGDALVVWSDAVPAPVAARYAWSDNPACNLADAAGLPASPFRTDNW